eukprot:875563_1
MEPAPPAWSGEGESYPPNPQANQQCSVAKPQHQPLAPHTQQAGYAPPQQASNVTPQARFVAHPPPENCATPKVGFVAHPPPENFVSQSPPQQVRQQQQVGQQQPARNAPAVTSAPTAVQKKAVR